MKLKNTVIIIAVAGAALIFGACSDSESSPVAGTTNVAIDVNCISSATAADLDIYVTTLPGDTIVKDEENTTINIVLSSEAVKKVCLESGAAHIVRSVSN